MYNRLLSFLNKWKTMNKNQFGFRKNHSTYMALLIMLENMRNALDNGECAIGIFLDFKKAFDTVNHDILLKKLYTYGIRGIALEWLKSYLSNRAHYYVNVSDRTAVTLLWSSHPPGVIFLTTTYLWCHQDSYNNNLLYIFA